MDDVLKQIRIAFGSVVDQEPRLKPFLKQAYKEVSSTVSESKKQEILGASEKWVNKESDEGMYPPRFVENNKIEGKIRTWDIEKEDFMQDWGNISKVMGKKEKSLRKAMSRYSGSIKEIEMQKGDKNYIYFWITLE